MKILVTGSGGFIGKNLVQFLKTKEDITVYEFDKNNTLKDLDVFCQDCDVVVNLAGVNRTTDANDFVKGNLGVVQDVVESLQKHCNNAPIIYSSSIQAEKDNDYGKSKRLGEDYLLEYSKKSGNKVCIFRFPNIFGKWSLPNYNTVIATFCYNVARDLPITINDRNIELTLVYIDDLVKDLYNAILGEAVPNINGFYDCKCQYKKTLGEIADLIYSFKETRQNLNVINTADEFEKKLYSTYLSFLPENEFSYNVKSNVDNRGMFTELIRTKNAGQFSVNIAKPGITKGNHWHNTKNEKFIVVKGKAVIKFRKPFETEVIEYLVDENNIQVVDVPCGYTHNITNIGQDDLVFFIWCNECFDKENPDTYFLEV